MVLHLFFGSIYGLYFAATPPNQFLIRNMSFLYLNFYPNFLNVQHYFFRAFVAKGKIRSVTDDF
ncbi:hypothetical protein C5S30_04300 [ANME-1 cluster archaeon GoMg4]|nr:hypothetical protein [ANME-1 cluster archaeon GoMg4]